MNRGGGDFGCLVTTLSAPKANLGNGNFWKFFRKTGFSDQFFGITGAENFGKFWYFSDKSPNFAKVEDFIA